MENNNLAIKVSIDKQGMEELCNLLETLDEQSKQLKETIEKVNEFQIKAIFN